MGRLVIPVDVATRKRCQRRDRTPGSVRHFPVQPLLDLCPHLTAVQLAHRVGVDRRTLTGWRIRWDVADRAAIGLGLHPVLVWGDDWLLPVDPADLEAAS